MASSITGICNIKAQKATPYLLKVLHSDTYYRGEGRTGRRSAVQVDRRMRDSTVLVVLLLATLGTATAGKC